MRIKEYQQVVDDWIKQHGVRYFDEMTNTVLLMEETGELARYMARIYGEQSFKTDEESSAAGQRIGDEMADILFVLTCLANQTGVDLEEAIRRNFAKKTARDHQRHKDNDKLS